MGVCRQEARLAIHNIVESRNSSRTPEPAYLNKITSTVNNGTTEASELQKWSNGYVMVNDHKYTWMWCARLIWTVVCVYFGLVRFKTCSTETNPRPSSMLRCCGVRHYCDDTIYNRIMYLRCGRGNLKYDAAHGNNNRNNNKRDSTLAASNWKIVGFQTDPMSRMNMLFLPVVMKLCLNLAIEMFVRKGCTASTRVLRTHGKRCTSRVTAVFRMCAYECAKRENWIKRERDWERHIGRTYD